MNRPIYTDDEDCVAMQFPDLNSVSVAISTECGVCGTLHHKLAFTLESFAFLSRLTGLTPWQPEHAFNCNGRIL